MRALTVMQAYLSAGAYTLARMPEGEPPPAAVTTPHQQATLLPAPSVFISPADAQKTADAPNPYRSSSIVRFAQATLPQGLVDHLFHQAYLTGRHHSLFRHGPSEAPLCYEIRRGSPTESERSVLGKTGNDDDFDDVLEEVFFGISWVGHIHPPQADPLPTDDDLNAVARRALVSGRRTTRHAVFGFHHGDPVAVELMAVYDPIFRGISMLHRASAALQGIADKRLEEWATSSGLSTNPAIR